MAKKTKKKSNAKKSKKAQARNAKAKKVPGIGYLGMAVIVVAAVLVLLLYTNPTPVQTPDEGEYDVPMQPQGTIESPDGGPCTRNSECFITNCKDGNNVCLNTVRVNEYYKNCGSYTDWVIEDQDASLCACVDNVCRML